MMNYSRFANRNRNQNPQDRNFGSDIHEFMDGLGRIAQIMYTSIPIIEFVKIALKYSWKFCEYLGTHALSLIGALKVTERHEDVMEALWNEKSRWGNMARYSSAAAVGVVLFCLLFEKPRLDQEWEKAEEVPVMQGRQEVRSVEDKPYGGEVYQDYPEYGMY